MKTSVTKLQKFFRLEAEREYDNRAVFGGLESMLKNWEAEARAEELPAELISAVVTRLRDYHRLTPESRAEVLKGIWARVRRELGAGDALEKTQIQEVEERKPTPEESVVEVSEQKKESVLPKTQKSTGPPAALEAPTTVLDGVGPKNAERLVRLQIRTLGDMLYHFPRRYDDYTQLKSINRLHYGDEVTIIATVQSCNVRQVGGRKTRLVEVIVNDGSGALRINWFNQPWLAKNFKKGTQLVLSGKVEQYLGRLIMNSPEWELLDQENLHTNRIVPVYPLTARISQRWLRGQMSKVVNYWAMRVQDHLPESVRESAKLMALPDALLQVHFPATEKQLRVAQHRLAFDEIFLLQLGLLQQKQVWEERSGRAFRIPEEWLQTRIGRLPFELTGAQRKVLEDIKHDLAAVKPMNRLVQGDVGSGKTVLAALAASIVNREGSQAALMAPTSILAEQHHKNLLLQLTGEGGSHTPAEIRLLLGATPGSMKAEIRAGLESGQIKIVVGTHALIEDPVRFSDLQLVIIDEQHRFGVKQRANLRSKGDQVNLLVMTATPIPRSLALTVYSDLDLSILDEMPPGRQPVETHLLTPRERERAYTLIKTQLNSGKQAFIIYPLVEESDKSDLKAAVEEHKRLASEVFPKHKLGLLHGRLKPEEKEDVMTRFRDGEYQILVSTTVVEVGVDVPNATVMLIENANRFGLAQLHQLRGRVGRGLGKSYCLLIPADDAAVVNERLQVMVETNDGFVLAEHDLEQRGPGEFLGTSQSGFAGLQMANITDVHLIEKARRYAQEVIAQDPKLEKPEHQLLAKAVSEFWTDGKGDIS
jgi:ATP-dependent DNA helicase RecG